VVETTSSRMLLLYVNLMPPIFAIIFFRLKYLFCLLFFFFFFFFSFLYLFFYHELRTSLRHLRYYSFLNECYANKCTSNFFSLHYFKIELCLNIQISFVLFLLSSFKKIITPKGTTSRGKN
jgi:hypothetical protein